MFHRSSSEKTLRAAMLEERLTTTTMASRLLSAPDASLTNPSFRVYYGVASAGSVPFLWESAPGTPKNAISDAALPPLTPPPSYYNKASSKMLAKSKSSKKLLPSSSSKPASFVHSILPKMRRSHTMPSPSSTAASKEHTAGVQHSGSRMKRLVTSPRSSFSSTSRGDDEDGRDAGSSSPTSTLCFRARHSVGGGGGGNRRLHGLLASVVGGQGRSDHS